MRRSHSQDNNLYLNLLAPPDNSEKARKSLPKNKKTKCRKCIFGIISTPYNICRFKNKYVYSNYNQRFEQFST